MLAEAVPVLAGIGKTPEVPGGLEPGETPTGKAAEDFLLKRQNC